MSVIGAGTLGVGALAGAEEGGGADEAGGEGGATVGASGGAEAGGADAAAEVGGAAGLPHARVGSRRATRSTRRIAGGKANDDPIA